jgi:hypothetical protein
MPNFKICDLADRDDNWTESGALFDSLPVGLSSMSIRWKLFCQNCTDRYSIPPHDEQVLLMILFTLAPEAGRMFSDSYVKALCQVFQQRDKLLCRPGIFKSKGNELDRR